jgi:hypothetical protein
MVPSAELEDSPAAAWAHGYTRARHRRALGAFLPSPGCQSRLRIRSSLAWPHRTFDARVRAHALPPANQHAPGIGADFKVLLGAKLPSRATLNAEAAHPPGLEWGCLSHH